MRLLRLQLENVRSHAALDLDDAAFLLREHRAARAVTMTRAAREVGISVSSYSALERGAQRPRTRRTVRALARWLGVDDGLSKSCETCGRSYSRPLEITDSEWDRRRYCRLRCAHDARASALWFSGGRWYVKARNGSSVAWARVVMEDELGRPLREGEVVHHRNGNSSDDRPANLLLCRDQREHMEIEWTLRGPIWQSIEGVLL